MRGVAAREHLAGQQQALAGLPRRDVFARQRVEIHAPRVGRRFVRELRPQLQVGRIELRRAGAVEHEVHVARGGAVRNDRDRQRRGVRRVILDLHVQHRRQSAESLRADAERVHLVQNLQAQRFDAVLRTARAHFVDVDGFEQRFLREHHRFLGSAADADAEHARRAPARAHLRHGLEDPVDDRIRRIQHRHDRLVLRAAAFRRNGDLQLVAGHDFHVNHGRRVVAGVLPVERRIGDDRGAQLVVGMVVGAAHAFVDHVGRGSASRPSARSCRLSRTP